MVPKIFKRLKADPVTNIPAVESVYSKQEILSKFLVAKQTEFAYEYLIFDSAEEFEDWFNDQIEADRLFHEVIYGDKVQKLKFDIDAPPEFTGLEEILMAITDTFYIEYMIELTADDVIVLSATDQTKKSFHIIIKSYAVRDHIEAQYFTNKVFINLDKNYHSFVDKQINNSRANFRMMGNYKLNSLRKFEPMDGDIIEFVDTLITQTAAATLLPSRVQTNVDPAKPILSISADHIAAILDLAAPYLTGHQMIRSTIPGLICFKRLQPTFCDLCQRNHDKDNTVLISYTIQDEAGHAYLNCRHNKETSKYLGAFIINLAKNQMAAADYLNKLISAPIEFPDKAIFNNFKPELINRYDEPALRDFEHTNTLCVIAAMKMGKTKKLVEYIEKNYQDTDYHKHSIIFVSFRQTFSANIKDKFKDFTLYSECPGREIRARRLIIQVESLYRYAIDMSTPKPDLVVLDESELIFEQFDSGLLKDFNCSWAVFQWLIRYSRHVVAMDAGMSDRTINMLNRLRIQYEPALSIFLHHNVYKNAVEDMYNITLNINQWYSSLHADIAAGLRVAIATSSLSEAEIMREIISNHYPDKSLGFYSSKTASKIKKDHFGAIDDYWSLYDVLIYTPTVSAGVSFEKRHYDKIYAYFIDKSCCVETCIQMLGRIRSVTTKQYVVAFNISGGDYPTTVENIQNDLKYNRHSLFDMPSGPIQFEFGESGELKFYSNEYFELWLENTKIKNLSRNFFLKRIIKYFMEYGASVKILESSAAGGDPPESSDLPKRGDIRRKLDADEQKNISAAAEISSEHIKDIQKKIAAQIDISAEDYDAYIKFKLRRDYSFGGDITPDFVKIYNNHSTRHNYKMLRAILAFDSLEKSLAEIQSLERATYLYMIDNPDRVNSDISRVYKYSQHRMAKEILETCGWSSWTDQKFIAETELAAAIHSRETILYNNLTACHASFNIHRPNLFGFKYIYDGVTKSDSQYVTDIVKYLNKVIKYMYGIKIIRDKSSLYKLSSITLFDISRDQHFNKSIPWIYGEWSAS